MTAHAIPESELRRLLELSCRNAGSQSAFARNHSMSIAYVNDVLHRRREPGPAILAALGLEKMPAQYRRIEK